MKRSQVPDKALQPTVAHRSTRALDTTERNAHEDDNMTPKPSFEGNNELALHVPDPVNAAEFYMTVLGCTLVSSDPTCVELVSGALRLFLLADPAPQHEALVPSFTVPDRNAALEALRKAGCVLVPIGPHALGEHYVRDPNGILFDVVERRL